MPPVSSGRHLHEMEKPPENPRVSRSAVQERSLVPHPAREQTNLSAVVRCLRPWYARTHHSAMVVEGKVIERQGCNTAPGSKVMATAFDEDTIHLLAKIDEDDIETRAGVDVPAHHVTIWVVVDGGTAYVHTERGTREAWCPEATAFTQAVVYAGGGTLPVNIEPISDAATIA